MTSEPCLPRVAVLDDCSLVRECLVLMLDCAGFPVVAQEGDAEKFLNTLSTSHAEVALVQRHLRNEDGERVIRLARLTFPALRVVAMDRTGQPGSARRCAAAGADAYLSAFDIQCPALFDCILSVMSGQKVFPAADAPGALDVLTTREREILGYVAAGVDNLKIAVLLGISERTVKAHVSALYRKLAQENRTQLALVAHRYGVVLPSNV